jgi:hypothetical protein
MTLPAIPDTPRASDRVCASCAGQTVGFGVVAKYKDAVLWCCGDPDCFVATLRTYQMPDFEFKRLEQIATVRGGEAAAAYAEEIGKSDMAEMEPAEWETFCERLVGGYRWALHETLKNESPF